MKTYVDLPQLTSVNSNNNLDLFTASFLSPNATLRPTLAEVKRLKIAPKRPLVMFAVESVIAPFKTLG
jgi:hypothetical protein